MSVSAVDRLLALLLLSRNPTQDLQLAHNTVAQEFADLDVRSCTYTADVGPMIGPGRWYPELVIVHQDWPGQYSESDVRELFALLPLARWICIRGVWCESDGRNGSPWPEAITVRAREAAVRIRHECAVLKGDHPALPLTASRDEAFTFSRHALPAKINAPAENANPTDVLVLSNDREWRRAIDDLLKVEGYGPVRSPSAKTECNAIVWDADPIDPYEEWDNDRRACGRGAGLLKRLAKLRASHPNVAIVVVTTMAHRDDVKQLRKGGAAAVVEKSQLAEVLAATLCEACRDRGIVSK